MYFISSTHQYDIHGEVDGLKMIINNANIQSLIVHESAKANGTLQTVDFQWYNVSVSTKEDEYIKKGISIDLDIQSRPLFLNHIKANFRFSK